MILILLCFFIPTLYSTTRNSYILLGFSFWHRWMEGGRQKKPGGLMGWRSEVVQVHTTSTQQHNMKTMGFIMTPVIKYCKHGAILKSIAMIMLAGQRSFFTTNNSAVHQKKWTKKRDTLQSIIHHDILLLLQIYINPSIH